MSDFAWFVLLILGVFGISGATFIIGIMVVSRHEENCRSKKEDES